MIKLMKKQFLLASALTLGISGLGTIGYAQASMTDAHGGSENVDNSHGLKASKTYNCFIERVETLL